MYWQFTRMINTTLTPQNIKPRWMYKLRVSPKQTKKSSTLPWRKSFPPEIEKPSKALPMAGITILVAQRSSPKWVRRLRKLLRISLNLNKRPQDHENTVNTSIISEPNAASQGTKSGNNFRFWPDGFPRLGLRKWFRNLDGRLTRR